MSEADTSLRSLDQWLSYFSEQHAKTIDLGLERVGTVAMRLGLSAKGLAARVITVAGTNGKGSTVAMIDACARAHGLKSVTYSSPHLLRYNERVRVNGVEASDKQFIEAFARIETARLEAPEISLSYFEAGTLAAALIIQAEAPDIAVLEVGLGGRLDAVNLFDADVAVVTTIALDHIDYLGSDISIIGREKAGIMRAGQSVVLGRSLPPSVEAYATEIGVSRLFTLGQDFDHRGAELPRDATSAGVTWRWNGRTRTGEELSFDALPDPHLPLDNASMALEALVMSGVSLETLSLRSAFSSVSIPGRFQHLGRWILDVAHNPHAAHYLASRLGASSSSGHIAPRRIALLGMLGDKDATTVVKELSPVINGWVCAGLDGERGRTGQSLADTVSGQGGKVLRVADDVSEALEWIENNTELSSYDVLVCGSFLTVAAALEWLEVREVTHALKQGVSG